MRPIELQSESYQPTGSISADGIKNQLGRPKLDRLSLLARESVQNSWDARLADKGVRFGMAGWELTDPQRKWLKGTFFKKLPTQGLELAGLLSSDHPQTVLAVYDRGTKGLCGPTRADEVGVHDSANFVNLLRNVGQPPAAFRGGGTYGFGKTALFLASQARTIIAHTQVVSGKKLEQRLIGAALGSQYTQGGSLTRGTKRYTGRHWWGHKDGNLVEPVIGRDASEAAKALGLPGFESGETGTTILILFPDFESQQPEDALRFIGEAILRSFWPKMVDGSRGGGSMAYELSWNGERIPMPRPQNVPPLNAYVRAFVNLQAHRSGKPIPHAGGWLQEIHSQRPARHLGTLSLLKFPPEPRLPSAVESDDGPFGSKSHHTALMRGPHFVVNYLEGPTLPYELAEYAGVFVASGEAEEAFARSEPPTHDDWVHDMLDDRHQRTFVKVGLRRIREGMQEFAGVSGPNRTIGSDVPLGEFSDLLGGLIPGEKGTGVGRGGQTRAGTEDGSGGEINGRDTPGNGRIASNGSAPRVQIVRTSEPDTVGSDSRPVVSVLFQVEPTTRSKKLRIRGRAMVLLEDGSTEAEPPVGAAAPEILSWTNAGGRVIATGSTVEIGSADNGPWTVAVAMTPDTAVMVELDAEQLS